MNRHKGYSLIELMIVVVIIGLLTSVAIPVFDSMMQRSRLRSALESFKSDVQWARIEAIKRSRSVIVSRTAGENGSWCYGFSEKTPETRTACNCLQNDSTANDFCEIKRVLGNGFNAITQVTATARNNTINFRRGTMSAGGVTFSSGDYAARVVFSDTGRVRVCIPDDMPADTIALPNTVMCNP